MRRYALYRVPVIVLPGVTGWKRPPSSYFSKIAAVTLRALVVLYLLCLGPDNVLQVGGEALADPFFGPVSGSDHQAEPGVGDLVADPGPAQTRVVLSRTETAQHALGQERDMGAGQDKWQKYRMNEGDKARNKLWKGGGERMRNEWGSEEWKGNTD